MKTLFSILLSFLLYHALQAQIAVVGYDLPPQGFNEGNAVRLNYSSSGTFLGAQVTVRLQERRSGVVFEAVFPSVDIIVGFGEVSSLTHLNEFRYGSGMHAAYLATQRKFLDGDYEFCVLINAVNNEPGFETCLPYQAMTVDVLNLIQPSDQEEIEETRPNLVWFTSHPPLQNSQDEAYQLILVECQKEQSAAEALSINAPILILDKLVSPQVPYPVNAVSLVPGKSYAWVVTHTFRGEPVRATEQWVFHVKPEEEYIDYRYYDINKASGGARIPVSESFYFRFKDAYTADSCIGRLFSEKASVWQEVRIERSGSELADGLASASGYRFDMSALGLDKGNYTLEVQDAKGMKYVVQINYKGL